MSKYRISLFIFLGVMLFSLTLVMAGETSMATPAFIAAFYLSLLAYAAFDIRLNFYLTSINSFQTKGHEIALTIDDSPTDILTERLLETLKKHDVKASFFCIGSNIDQHPKTFDAIQKAGHFVANHSNAHQNLMPFWNRNKLMQDYEMAKEKLGDHGQNHFFRPPFGITNPNIAYAVRNLQLNSIGWNIRSLDTRIHHPGRITARILRRIKPGSILLFHDNRVVTPQVLDELLPELKKRNYTFITVDEILHRYTV